MTMKYSKEEGIFWELYVPEKGQADTVQGELLRAMAKIFHETWRNGNINWDKSHEMFLDYLREHLMDTTVFTVQELNVLSDQLERLNNFEEPCDDNDLSDNLFDAVVYWIMQHPEPIGREHDNRQWR